MAKSSPGSSRRKAGPHPRQDALPSQGYLLIHPLSDWDNLAHLPKVYIFGMREETGVPRENLRSREETMQTPQGQWPRLGIGISPIINVVIRQH